MEPEAFERVVEVNLLGVYRTVHAALPAIVARRGQVVVVASIYAFMRRITPALVAERLVAGIERRAPRVIVPRWYARWFALRGVLNPLLDRAMAHDPRIAELVERAEAQPPRARERSGPAGDLGRNEASPSGT